LGGKRGNVVRTGSYNVLDDPVDQRAREWRTQPNRQKLLAAPDSATNSSVVPNADILGFALEGSSSLHGSGPEQIDGFPFLDENFLLQLTRKYPNGTIWLIREDGSLSTCTDEVEAGGGWISDTAPSSKKYDYEHRKAEAAALQNALPQARQILFVPLFEAELSRAQAGCLSFTTDVTRVLSAEAELGFVKSFVNSVGAQVARINAVAADKSKNAFIGSISHELRSPLHGILAAAEFLEDTDVDTYQKGLINTQVSCGKTLLQVIEHVLDYSKINSFEKVLTPGLVRLSPLIGLRMNRLPHSRADPHPVIVYTSARRCRICTSRRTSRSFAKK
jgi:signal transduction histidine kinase